ncbi:MAG: site-2 protease family protein [Chloroflexota bacterium]
MNQSVQVFKVWGIPVGYNSSWYLIFGLITWSLATGYMPSAYPELSTAQYWIIALITSILFFGSVIFHELAHALFALRDGIKVNRITLFIFGGVAELDEEPKSPLSEFKIAIAGPISSGIAAGVFYAISLAGQGYPLIEAPAAYLATINLLLAVFNLIPGFPLDGGRVLRAAVWYFKGYGRATKVAAFTGRLVAYGFIGLGVFRMFTGDFFNGLWLLFIGWFLNNSAQAHGQQAEIKVALDDITVSRIMRPTWQTIDGNLPISKLVNDYIVTGDSRYYFVKNSGYGYEEDERPHGMLTISDISSLAQQAWKITPAKQIMTGWEQLTTTSPSAQLLDAVRQMEEKNVHQLPVLEEGNLVGVLTRENVLQFIRMKGNASPASGSVAAA